MCVEAQRPWATAALARLQGLQRNAKLLAFPGQKARFCGFIFGASGLCNTLARRTKNTFGHCVSALPGRARKGCPLFIRDRFLTLRRPRAPSRVRSKEKSTNHGRLPRDEPRRPRDGRATTRTRELPLVARLQPRAEFSGEALRADGRAGPRAAAAPRLRARRAGAQPHGPRGAHRHARGRRADEPARPPPARVVLVDGEDLGQDRRYVRSSVSMRVVAPST